MQIIKILASSTPEIDLIGKLISFSGVLVSAFIAGLVAFVVAAQKTKYELRKERANRKLDVAYKYAELHSKDANAAQLFSDRYTKDTAIGFLFLDDNQSREKIWIRNDSNILFGRQNYCDVVFTDEFISREHCVFHSQDNNTFIVPLNPTNDIKIGFFKIKKKRKLKSGDKIKLHADYPHNYVYFKF